MTTLSIIIPVYNEGKKVSAILDKIKEVKLINGIKKELIIVNDASKDDSAKYINDYIENNKELNIRYYEHKKNQGKGAAVHTGIKETTGDYIVIQDADLEYDPEEYNLLLKPLETGFADVVYGSRYLGGNPRRIMFYRHNKGNKLLTEISNIFSNLGLSDMNTCYKCFKSNILKSINLKEKRFGFDPEVTYKMARLKDIKVYEVGISYYGRNFDEGKKIGWKDGVRSIYCAIKYGFLKAK